MGGDKSVKRGGVMVYSCGIITGEVWAVYNRRRVGGRACIWQGFRPEETNPNGIVVGLFEDVGVVSGSNQREL